jgi:tetratricopeptide (TPR) repeat protein
VVIVVSTILLTINGVEIPYINIFNLILFFIFSSLMVYIHEAGHVLAAKAVGIGISRVQFGKGRDILRKRIFGILIVVKNQLGGGCTSIGEFKNEFSKPAYAFFIAGGLIIQTVLTVLAIIISDFRFSDYFGNYEIDLAASFIIANISMIAINLIPMKVNVRGFSTPNDGLSLLQLPFIKEKDINTILLAPKWMEAFELYENRKYYEAQLAFEKCLMEYPDLPDAKIGYSTCLLNQGKIDLAEEILLEIKNQQHDKKYDLTLFNNIAWINILRFTEESLKIADDFSKKAIKLNQNISFVKGARATTLIVSGNYDAGIKLLNEIVKISKPVDSETNNIAGFMMMGYAYLKKGKATEAMKYLIILKQNMAQMDEGMKILFEKLKQNSEELRNEFCTDTGKEKSQQEAA